MNSPPPSPDHQAHATPLDSDWDVVVIGAGPGGALSALLAARAGHSVLLVDRKEFPREKVCGGCLNNRALSILDRADLLPRLAPLQGNWIDRFVVRAADRELAFPLPGGLALSRRALDPFLIEQARQAGARFLPATPASVLPEPPAASRRRIELARPGPIRQIVTARVVVVAAGLGNSTLAQLSEFTDHVAPASRVGLGLRAPLALGAAGPPWGTITMLVGRNGYVGLTREETGAVHLAAAVDPAALRSRGEPGRSVAEILAQTRTPVTVPLEAHAWRGTGPLTHGLNRSASHRLFVIGDARRYVEPFTGEGMAWALSQAWQVAPLVTAATTHWSDQLAQEWNRQANRHAARGCRMLAAAVRWPRTTASVLTGLTHLPGLARWAARTLDPPGPDLTRWRTLLHPPRLPAPASPAQDGRSLTADSPLPQFPGEAA